MTNIIPKHSETFLRMASQTDRHEIPDKNDGYGKKTGQCGDTIEIFLSTENDIIKRVSFEINGCLNTLVCANTVAQISEGKSIEYAWNITPDDVIKYLQSLPSGEHHCAELAIGAFYLALSNHNELKKHTWKKNYFKRQK